uniref:Uncharacterized protein n=1 Tax=Palpitomonas bilix TaxID=652834 RepID=A0A7S3DGV0_9EUKA
MGECLRYAVTPMHQYTYTHIHIHTHSTYTHIHIYTYTYINTDRLYIQCQTHTHTQYRGVEPCITLPTSSHLTLPYSHQSTLYSLPLLTCCHPSLPTPFSLFLLFFPYFSHSSFPPPLFAFFSLPFTSSTMAVTNSCSVFLPIV